MCSGRENKVLALGEASKSGQLVNASCFCASRCGRCMTPVSSTAGSGSADW